MKKIVGLAVILMTMLCACQESPESDIIDQKGNNAVQSTLGDESNVIANYETPESWQENITYDNSEIKLEIDAKIEIPAAEKFPTYKIDESAGISQERVNLLMEEVFGDANVYDSNKEMTKSELEDQILRLKQQKAETEAEPDEGGNRGQMSVYIADAGQGAPEIINDRSAIFDRMIETYEEMLATAPDMVEEVILVPSVKDTGEDFVSFAGTGMVEGKGSYSISYMASKKNNIAPSFSIHNAEYRLMENEDSEEQNAESAPKREEAIACAEELVQKLGLTGMVVSKVTFAEQIVSGNMFGSFSDAESTGVYGYMIEFSKEVDGIDCISGDNFRGANISSGRSGSGGSVIGSGAVRSSVTIGRSLTNESLTIGITRKGIEEISWNGYFEISDVITEDAGLLAFEEIQELFKKNMELTYTVNETDQFTQFFEMNQISDTYHIYKAVLCYTKTAVTNDSNHSMLVPVWAFYSYQVDENGAIRYNSSPVMLINAMDGSVI